MNCGKIIKDMKKWIRIFNDRWYCRKSGENRIDESNRYYFINNKNVNNIGQKKFL